MSFSRLAMIGALAGALALGACGRKGPLDLPPSANSMAAAPPADNQPSLGEADNRNFEERSAAETPTAGHPAQKSFVLDPLLGDPPRKSPPPPTPPKQ